MDLNVEPTLLQLAYLEACDKLGDATHNFPEDMGTWLRRMDEDGFAIVRMPVKTVGCITGASCQRTAMNWGLTLEAAQAARAEFIKTGSVEFTGVDNAGRLHRIILTSGR